MILQAVADPEFYEQALMAMPVPQSLKRAPTIGFVQTWSDHIWYRIIVSVMQARARQIGVKLLIEDTANVAEQLNAISGLLESGVDALIVVPAAEKGLEPAIEQASRRNVSIITESDPLPGSASLVAIDDGAAGRKVGRRIGTAWSKQRTDPPRVLDIGLPDFASCRSRSDGFMSGLREICPDADWVARVDGRAHVQTSQCRAAEALGENNGVNLIFGIDDESAYGGLLAWREIGRDESELWVATFGVAGDEEKHRLMSLASYRAGLLMFPEYVAVLCLDAAVAAACGSLIPPRTFAPTVAIDARRLSTYYRAVDSHWLPDFHAIASILSERGEA